MEDFKKEFVVLFLSVNALYKRPSDPDPIPAVYNIWYDSIKQFGFKEVKRAFSLYVRSGKFMARPADIIQILEGSHQSNSFIAWTKVKKAFGEAGAYQSVVFDDLIIHTVIQDMGGWIKLCQSQEKELPFIKNDFTARYQAFKTSGGVTDYPKQLEGLHNAENRQKGLIEDIKEPILIGDVKKAQLVLERGFKQLEQKKGDHEKLL